MADDELHPDTTPEQEEGPESRAASDAAADGDLVASAEHRREDEVSWLGCLWLVVVPGIILAAVVVMLNWLGC